VNKLDFHLLQLMPYPGIPDGDEIESSWITLPNSRYDPELGHRLYSDYLEQAVAAERLGYDGVCVEEHHQTAYGTMPAPNLMAAAIAARTDRLPIAVVGNSLPLEANPLRAAEELAMLDVMSGGRIVAGLVRGTGMDYYSSSANPAWSLERFWEGHDLIVRAWTEAGPFPWQGEHFHLPFVNPWPRPLQRPHPPIWLPGTGAVETIEKAAERRYPFVMVFAPQWFTRSAFDLYRRAADGCGYEASPKQLAASIPVYVADTDEQAHREVRPHVEWMFRTGLKIPPHQWFPPGFMSKKSFAAMLEAKAEHGMKDHWQLTYEELVEQRYVIVGSTDTVIEQLTELTDDVGVGILLGAGGQIGSMPHEQALESAERMAEQVFPHFREPGNRPSYELAGAATS
jgi:alkanesulfonate monooxygenase SsuD/methylene tetrahydromethanopterin reductase-like flavin-dependent oxidoreductase (luciferase family)